MHLTEFCSLSARRGIDRTASSSGHSPLKPGRGAGGKRGGVRWSAVECGGARWRAVEKMDNRQPEMPERCHGAAGAGAAVRCTRGGVGTRSELVADGMLRCTCDARSSVAQTLNFRSQGDHKCRFHLFLVRGSGLEVQSAKHASLPEEVEDLLRDQRQSIVPAHTTRSL